MSARGAGICGVAIASMVASAFVVPAPCGAFLENFAVDDHGMLLAVATCASTVRSTAGVNGATLQEDAPGGN
jgi:hypothetical protein